MELYSGFKKVVASKGGDPEIVTQIDEYTIAFPICAVNDDNNYYACCIGWNDDSVDISITKPVEITNRAKLFEAINLYNINNPEKVVLFDNDIGMRLLHPAEDDIELVSKLFELQMERAQIAFRELVPEDSFKDAYIQMAIDFNDPKIY